MSCYVGRVSASVANEAYDGVSSSLFALEGGFVYQATCAVPLNDPHYFVLDTGSGLSHQTGTIFDMQGNNVNSKWKEVRPGYK